MSVPHNQQRKDSERAHGPQSHGAVSAASRPEVPSHVLKEGERSEGSPPCLPWACEAAA